MIFSIENELSLKTQWWSSSKPCFEKKIENCDKQPKESREKKYVHHLSIQWKSALFNIHNKESWQFSNLLCKYQYKYTF